MSTTFLVFTFLKVVIRRVTIGAKNLYTEMNESRMKNSGNLLNLLPTSLMFYIQDLFLSQRL